jgi:hypothetical protein
MNTNRRQFFKRSAGIFGVILSSPLILQTLFSSKAEAQKAEDCSKLPLVEPGKGMAISVNYFHKHSDMKKAELKTERQGVKWDQQNCKNCMLYVACGKKGADEIGKCAIFAGQAVKASGWCTTWSKKG